jgi:site-specific recombinase XerD
MYELQHRVKGQESTNSKQMISWNEFYSYFIDYREIEDRNRNVTQGRGQNVLKDVKSGKLPAFDPEEEVRTLLETEKQRRLLELPRLRPADQIDISEEQLQMIKDIYEN